MSGPLYAIRHKLTGELSNATTGLEDNLRALRNREDRHNRIRERQGLPPEQPWELVEVPPERAP